MSNTIKVDEQAVLRLLWQAGCEGNVVCHQPSKLTPPGNMNLMTHEEAWKHLDSEQHTVLLFPPKRMINGYCRSWSSDEKSLTIVQRTSRFMSMVEVAVKALDTLGDHSKYLHRIYRLLPASNEIRKKDPLFFSMELG